MPFLRDRGTRRIMHLTLLAVLGLYCSSAPAQAAEKSKADPDVLASGFLVEHPGVRYFKSQDRITRIYGRVFGGGDTPEQAAQAFVQKHIRMFGIQPADLHAKSNLYDRRHVQPLMYNRETGEYKFTLVYFTQHFNGVPVFRADVRLLARNEPGHPLVLAVANLKDLRSFTATPNSDQSENGKLGRALAKEAYPSLVNFTEPERVIWAGVDDMIVQPAVAYVFTGDNRGVVDAMQPVRRLFLADAATGAILYSESLIHHTDVSGNVSGNASEGPGADICEPELLTPMPYARVNIGGTQAFGDENGDFVIPNGGNSPVTVQSPVRGQRFVVSNASGSNTVLSMTVTPPGPANFVHNTANTSELIRAEVNAYVQANLVRDAIVAANPSYPQIGSQTNFSVVVNRTDGFCPGNA